MSTTWNATYTDHSTFTPSREKASGTFHALRLAMMSDWTLTASDRCDAKACNARAYVRVTIALELSDLFFCSHHGKKYRDNLVAICHDYVDESEAMFA